MNVRAQQPSSGAPVFIPSNDGSSVTFEIKNLGINSKGSFSGLTGKIAFDPKSPAGAVFDVSLDAATINTDNDMRDSHLKGETYFDVANHPLIRFLSTAVTAAGGGRYVVTGQLTLKNTTKEISFPFIATPIGNDLIFAGKFNINRKDFDIGGTSTLGSNVTISLYVLAKRQ